MNADLNESEKLFSQSLIDGFNESVPETHAESVNNSATANEPSEHVENVTEVTVEDRSSNDSTLLSDICTTQIESKLLLQLFFV